MKNTKEIQGFFLDGTPSLATVIHSYLEGKIVFTELARGNFLLGGYYLAKRDDDNPEDYYFFYKVPKPVIAFFYIPEDKTFFWDCGNGKWYSVRYGIAENLQKYLEPEEKAPVGMKYQFTYHPQLGLKLEVVLLKTNLKSYF